MFAEVMREAAYRLYRIRLEMFLHIPTNATDQDIHEIIEAGFSPAGVMALCELGALGSIERNHVIPLRTLKARLARDQRLTIHESDRLFNVVHILAMAEALFEDRAKARRWLSKSKNCLSGRSPIEMLSTTHGTRRIEEMLIQLVEPYAF